MSVLLLLLAVWIFAVLTLFGVGFGRTLRVLWQEPVFRHPVVIVESDDWGPGSDTEAARLDALARLFKQCRNSAGHSPVLTLGLVLAVPDTQLMRADIAHYHRRLLSDPAFSGMRDAIKRGRDAGVFALHLHGMEHYWPPTLIAMTSDERIRGWLTQESVPHPEDLPSALQSRWTDASVLPSKPLSLALIHAAVKDEVAAFGAVFGEPARVVVPPTFVWDRNVEAAWAAAGVRVVVTPGFRFEGRDSAGAPALSGARIYNGNGSVADLMYVVRDDYFEPLLGHRAERGWEAVCKKLRTGRPTLFETHRFNFIGSAPAAQAAIDELGRMLNLIVERFPDVLFMSTLELAEGIRRRDPALIDKSVARRVHVWLARLEEVSRIRKLAWLTGAMLPAWALFRLTGSTTMAGPVQHRESKLSEEICERQEN